MQWKSIQFYIDVKRSVNFSYGYINCYVWMTNVFNLVYHFCTIIIIILITYYTYTISLGAVMNFKLCRRITVVKVCLFWTYTEVGSKRVIYTFIHTFNISCFENTWLLVSKIQRNPHEKRKICAPDYYLYQVQNYLMWY